MSIEKIVGVFCWRFRVTRLVWLILTWSLGLCRWVKSRSLWLFLILCSIFSLRSIRWRRVRCGLDWRRFVVLFITGLRVWLSLCGFRSLFFHLLSFMDTTLPRLLKPVLCCWSLLRVLWCSGTCWEIASCTSSIKSSMSTFVCQMNRNQRWKRFSSSTWTIRFSKISRGNKLLYSRCFLHFSLRFCSKTSGWNSWITF